MLRYKSTYARVLDVNRKFLQAAVKYHDLSLAYLYTDAIDPDDLLIMLGKAATMAILSPNSAQRQRVLGMVYKDPQLHALDAMAEYQSHSSVVTKMYLNRVVQKRELELFECCSCKKAGRLCSSRCHRNSKCCKNTHEEE